MRKKLSREEILRNILKYKLQQRRRKAAGECLPRHHHWERLQCVGCNIWNDQKLTCLEPPLCCNCCKLYRNVKSVRPENKPARLARKRLAEKFRRRGLNADGTRIGPRMTRARKRSAIDLTGDSDGDDAPPVQNELLAAHARATNERLVAVKREVVDERARADDQGTNAMYLTAQKSEIQQLVSDAARALIEADVPTHECPDDDTPFYYMLESHRDDGKQTVPWNAEAGRAMTLAEGIAWLQNNPSAKRRRRH